MNRLIKIDVISGKETDLGPTNNDDIKLITAGYKFNGMFYERKGSKYIYLDVK